MKLEAERLGLDLVAMQDELDVRFDGEGRQCRANDELAEDFYALKRDRDAQKASYDLAAREVSRLSEVLSKKDAQLQDADADGFRSTGAEMRGAPAPGLAGALDEEEGAALPISSPSMSSPSMSSSWPNMDCNAALGGLLAGGWLGPRPPPPPPLLLPPTLPWLIVSPLTKRLVPLGSSKSLIHCACSAASCSSSFLRFASRASLCFWKGVFFVPPSEKVASLSEVILRTAPGLMVLGVSPKGKDMPANRGGCWG